ncbi:MAG: hypothetical protein PHY92_02235 [Alphaproteobacteria bacterium]|nr:hypothetical protein [Alphaproteobacteria bacterium]
MLACDYFIRVHRKKWWDLSDAKPNGPPPDWDAVKKLMEDDPIGDKRGCWFCRFLERWRSCGVLRLFLEVTVAFLCVIIWGSGFLLIIQYGAKPLSKQIYNVGVGIGGIGVFLTFAGVLYTGRIYARSVNRQKWINELRGALSKLIHEIPEWGDRKRKVTPVPKYEKTLLAKVELLLNPSELDHRALIALLRHLYRIYDLDIDKIVRKKLKLDCDECMFEGKTDKEALVKKFRERKSQLIRLINAVLKREWEQVKHVR